MSTNQMRILPFQFTRFNENEYLLVNESGEFLFIDSVDFQSLIQHNLTPNDTSYLDLKSKHFLNTEHLPETIELISTKYRSRKKFVTNFTVLHMMVITLRCCNSCSYCQVSAEGDDAHGLDMTPETARRIVDCIFKTPSKNIKIEFQGGEPTLNWETIRETVLYAKKLNGKHKKSLQFVVCTNLVKTTTEQLMFYKEHNIHISTSLDGPKDLHDKNRPLRNGGGTYDLFIENLYKTKNILGHDQVNALMTTTLDSIDHLDDVVDEYVKHGFRGVFFRPLNPYGLASEREKELGYPAKRFVESYEKALDRIIKINLNGTFFVEFFTKLLLSRILIPFSTGFVDLQSPSGAGISGVIYDHNGDVFPTDEARMLARMGDRHFFMGNVFKDSYESIFGGTLLRDIVSKSCVEIMPYCSSCAYRSYCGADPVRNYLESGDITGKRPNEFCHKHKLIFDLLFKKIKRNDPDEMDVLWSWVSSCSLEEIRREKI
ncbi:MAG: His-Xaa-Ser system radical SAM maturase HxsB [Gammaproteobacteria bacterium]|nr:His-Xaa-Ser system radical SAM maturase HxsB [Gammaproteobacteria bacterium]